MAMHPPHPPFHGDHKQRRRSIRYESEDMACTRFDVAVVGGGTAGVFAAIAAARCGANTVLCEKNNRLGGTLIAGGVNFPGLFFAWGKQIIDGPCWEAVTRTAALGGATLPRISRRPAHHWDEQIELDKLVYLKVLNDMCREAGVTVKTGTILAHAEERPTGMRLFLADKSGLSCMECSAAVDATGDADLTRMLGCPCQKSREQQPATLDNRLTGYDISAVNWEQLRQEWQRHPICRAGPAVSFERLQHFLITRKIDCHIPCTDADLPTGRAHLEREAVDVLFEYRRFLRGIEGLAGLTYAYIAEETGVRESNRIVGESTVTAEDYVAGRRYPDAIAYAFYPIDRHVEGGIEQVFLTDGVVPTIPFGALIPKGASRLICAGRMISSDPHANSALRVQAPCMAMGQVAGAAAAEVVRVNVPLRSLDMSRLRTALTSIGAIVP